MLHLLTRTGRHLRRRSVEREELVDYVQREVGTTGRNAAMATQTRTPNSNNNLRRLRRARKEFKTALFSAKEEWTTAFAKSVKKGQKNGGGRTQDSNDRSLHCFNNMAEKAQPSLVYPLPFNP